jgi:hypothetical protein
LYRVDSWIVLLSSVSETSSPSGPPAGAARSLCPESINSKRTAGPLATNQPKNPRLPGLGYFQGQSHSARTFAGSLLLIVAFPQSGAGKKLLPFLRTLQWLRPNPSVARIIRALVCAGATILSLPYCPAAPVSAIWSSAVQLSAETEAATLLFLQAEL